MKWCYLFSAAFLLFALHSCYTPRYVYSPAAHNTPVLVKKGDSKLAANYSFTFGDNAIKSNVSATAKARGLDAQAAYAFTNHWAGMVNYFYRQERNAGDFDSNLRDSTVINYHRNLTEIAAGYFHALDDNKHVFFQVFAGVGFGKSNFTDNGRDQNQLYRSRYHAMNVTKLFIQPAIMVGNQKRFSAIFSSRYSVIYFKNIKTDYTAAELDNYKLDSLSYSPRVFWEPATIYNFGFKELPGIKLEFQMGFSFLVSKRFVDYRSSNISVGLLFDLPKLFANNRHSSKN